MAIRVWTRSIHIAKASAVTFPLLCVCLCFFLCRLPSLSLDHSPHQLFHSHLHSSFAENRARVMTVVSAICLCLFSHATLRTDTIPKTICFGFCGLTILTYTFYPLPCHPIRLSFSMTATNIKNYFWITKPLDICIVSMISFLCIAAAAVFIKISTV